MPGPCKTPCLKSMGLRFPRAAPVLTHSRSLSDGSSRCPDRAVTSSKVSDPFSRHFPAGGPNQLRSREPLGSDTRTNVLFKFWLGKRRGVCGERATCR